MFLIYKKKGKQNADASESGETTSEQQEGATGGNPCENGDAQNDHDANPNPSHEETEQAADSDKSSDKSACNSDLDDSEMLARFSSIKLNDKQQQQKIEILSNTNAADSASTFNADDDDDYHDKDFNENSDESEDEHERENQFKLDSMQSLSALKFASERGVASLESCLSNFTSIETLADKIHCENCTRKLYGGGDDNSRSHGKNKWQEVTKKKKAPKQAASAGKVYTRAIKQYLICELPRVLTIHLKRFQQHGFRLEKSNKHVNFPLVLNMAPFTSMMCVNLASSSRPG